MNNKYIHRFPADVQGTQYCKYQIIEVKDSIAVIMNPRYWESKVILWTGYGFERPWTLRYSFDVASAVDRVHGSINNNGDILFKSSEGAWLLHNLDKKEDFF